MKKGFTLVELIVVVIIIGVLAAVGVPQLRRTLERARGAEALSGLGHIQSAQKVYYALNEKYIATGAEETIQDIQNYLDINIAEENWEFRTTIVDADDQFFYTVATRSGGPCDGSVITMTVDGMADDPTFIEVGGNMITIGGGCWEECVGGL